MASYFDLPPQDKAASTSIQGVPENERKKLGGSSLLSPAVTQLLDDLGDDVSDSDSDEGETSRLSKESDARQVRSEKPEKVRSYDSSSLNPGSALSPNKGDRSPTSRSGHSKSPSSRTGTGRTSKPKQPHMARFHSLRSMLFTSTMENKLDQVKQEETQKQEAAGQWKSEHDQRQMNRPRTPEKEVAGKPKLGKRIKSKIRRMTSKEVPTLDTLKEDGAAHDFSDHGSTASSDAEDERERPRYRDTDEESINHSDIEDLVRWVSRKDPPSDGEARVASKGGVARELKEDSGHESLGHSDVEDLVRWVSRKPADAEEQPVGLASYSDASTEEDTELESRDPSSGDEDADDLMRWVSHRDGPNAGPVRYQSRTLVSDADSHISYDSDVPELGDWVKRHDGTSGESSATTPAKEFEDPMEEMERGRPRSRDRPSSREARNHLTHDDIGDLVRWVSRKDSKQQASIEPDQDPDLKELKRQEEAKQHAIGMSVDEGSLSHSDVKGLLEHVQSTNITAEASKPTIQILSDPPRPGAGESGVLRRENTEIRDARKFAAQEHLQKSRGESKQIDEHDFTIDAGDPTTDPEQASVDSMHTRDRDGSLGNDDVDELVKWVSQKS